MDYHSLYHTMADGTVKQINPFTGVEVWTVSERGNRAANGEPDGPPPEPLERMSPEGYCSFCESRLLETAPEKSRVVRRGDCYVTLHHVMPEQQSQEAAEFRRVANLFEIVSINYWRQNYNYKLSPQNIQWKDQYLSSPLGIRHVMGIIDQKLKLSGKSDEEIAAVSPDVKLTLADAFFGGGHEIIIARPHYRSDAQTTADLFSTGDMTDEQHAEYYHFIIDALVDIISSNRYVRYISVFKNWLRPAGASLNHLHTQIVAIDEWGSSIDRQVKMLVADKNVFNTYGPNFAGLHNLVFAENDFALAFVGIGHRYPTVEIFSKSINARPYEHQPQEIRGVSDLVRACHAAIGGSVSVNEEWYYTPIDCIFKMPWHINLKLRMNVPAGFEGGTSIFINPLSPVDLRDRLVPRLYQLRGEGRINPSIRIAEECIVVPNPLQYYRTC
ncbi:MAG: DUF4921 family protein [Bacteroidota bacterium]|nr:DUF4921 family protein [Bacteroidota bacterium]